jgi:hypothetical protein
MKVNNNHMSVSNNIEVKTAVLLTSPILTDSNDMSSNSPSTSLRLQKPISNPLLSRRMSQKNITKDTEVSNDVLEIETTNVVEIVITNNEVTTNSLVPAITPTDISQRNKDHFKRLKEVTILIYI